MIVRTFLGLFPLAIFLAACAEDEPADPDPAIRMAEVAGDYAAEGEYGVHSLTTTSDGETVDQLAQGLSLTITLTADGVLRVGSSSPGETRTALTSRRTSPGPGR